MPYVYVPKKVHTSHETQTVCVLLSVCICVCFPCASCHLSPESVSLERSVPSVVQPGEYRHHLHLDVLNTHTRAHRNPHTPTHVSLLFTLLCHSVSVRPFPCSPCFLLGFLFMPFPIFLSGLLYCVTHLSHVLFLCRCAHVVKVLSPSTVFACHSFISGCVWRFFGFSKKNKKKPPTEDFFYLLNCVVPNLDSDI